MIKASQIGVLKDCFGLPFKNKEGNIQFHLDHQNVKSIAVGISTTFHVVISRIIVLDNKHYISLMPKVTCLIRIILIILLSGFEIMSLKKHTRIPEFELLETIIRITMFMDSLHLKKNY
jgi:hypothetical protein